MQIAEFPHFPGFIWNFTLLVRVPQPDWEHRYRRLPAPPLALYSDSHDGQH
jgi:hypothetical protein